jgi:hypothetical protein
VIFHVTKMDPDLVTAEEMHLLEGVLVQLQMRGQTLNREHLILSFRVTNFLFANSQNTQPHFIIGMTCKCIALLFFL